MRKKYLWILIPVVVLIITAVYYQLFYKSPRVDTGLASLEKVYQEHHSIVTSVRFSADDSLVFSSGVDSNIVIRERSTGKLVRLIKNPCGIAYMDLSEDGNFLATGGYDAVVRLYRSSDGVLIRSFKAHKGTVWTVALSPDSKLIASGGDDAIVYIWNTETGELVRKLQGHKRIVWSVKFSPDGKQLASASFDFSWKLWNLAEGNLLWNNTVHAETVVDLAFSHDGNLLASTSDDKTIKVWDLKKQKLLRNLETAEHVQAVAFSPDDKRLLTGGRDKPMIGELLQNLFGDSKFNPGVSARLWDLSTGNLLQTFTSHGNDVMDLDYSHDGNWIATASADKTVELWKINRR